MTVTTRTYPTWRAPTEDGQALISPSIQDLTAELFRRTDLSLSDAHQRIRSEARTFLGFDASAPLIVTGHQIELHHPGVWVKNILINEIAKKVSGQAMHLAVDTDEPKHLQLRWPGGSIPITDDPALATAAWSGLVELPTPQHLEKVRDAFSAASREWGFESHVPSFLGSIKRLLLEAPNLVHAVTNATHSLEWELGLRHHVMIASPIWSSRAFLAFAHDVFSHLDDFAADYNASLAEYRTAAGIKSAGRPMPDLKLSADDGEAPFWLDDLSTGQRVRATSLRADGRWTLEIAGKDRFSFDPALGPLDGGDALLAFLRRHNHRLAPRAITLTMFTRLFLADLFVHGIGGGQYDQVTDRLIARRYNIEPPPFAVTTATLYFPLAAGQPRACVPCVEEDGRRIRHGLLGERKMDLVSRIAAHPRRSNERRELFYTMHRELAGAATSSDALRNWEATLDVARHAERSESAVFDREFFFAIQPRDRLEAIIKKYQPA